MNRRYLVPFFALLICALCPLFVGGFAVADDEAKPDEAKPDEAKPDEAKPDEPKAADDADRAEIIAMVDELRSVAAEIRGLEWKFKVPADLLTRKQLAANLKKMVKEELKPEELERDTRILRRIGMLTEDEDPLQMVLAFLEAGIGGYFDPDKKRLFMIAGLDAKAQKPVILHELIHALEDQYYDLKARTEPIKYDPDRLFADKVLVEGSAEMARLIYENTHPDAARDNVKGSANREGGQAQAQVLRITPLFLYLSTILHYRTGPNFVIKSFSADEYPKKMGELYANPPTTQEQVLHPSRWWGDRDYPRTIVWGGDFAAAAGEGWKKMHEVPVGELDMAVYVDFFLGKDNGRATQQEMGKGNYVSEESVAVATGWDAGRSYYVDSGDRIGVIEGFSFDSLDDAKEAFDAYKRCLEKANGDAWKTDGVDHGIGKPTGEAPDVTALDFSGKHGAGRILLRGAELLVAEGFTPEELGRVWGCVRKTKFVKDARDKGDETARLDHFEGYDFIDRDRHFGIKLLEGWVADAAPPGLRAQMPMAVALVSKGETPQIVVILVDQGQSEGALIPSLANILKNFGVTVDEAKVEKSMIAGMPGVSYAIGPQRFHLASDGVRSILAQQMAAPDEASAAEAKQILANMKVLLGY